MKKFSKYAYRNELSNINQNLQNALDRTNQRSGASYCLTDLKMAEDAAARALDEIRSIRQEVEEE